MEIAKTTIPNGLQLRRIRPAGFAVALAPEGAERASALASLNGVLEPMASAILTVWDPAGFTVYDYRARATLRRAGQLIGVHKTVTYGYYLGVCRSIAARLTLPAGDVPPLRLLDRALWKYSKDHDLE